LNQNYKNEIKINDSMNNNKLKIEKNAINDELNEKYINIIDNNPEILFEIITPQTISIWQSKLYYFDLTIINSDNQIITTIPERRDQNVIKIDSKRTKFREK
jgi:hypothetical protein